MPVKSLVTLPVSPVVRTATSNRALETSTRTQMSLILTPVLLGSVPLTSACLMRALRPQHSFEFNSKACSDPRLRSISKTFAYSDLPHFSNIQALTICKVSGEYQSAPALRRTDGYPGSNPRGMAYQNVSDAQHRFLQRPQPLGPLCRFCIRIDASFVQNGGD